MEVHATSGGDLKCARGIGPIVQERKVLASRRDGKKNNSPGQAGEPDDGSQSDRVAPQARLFFAHELDQDLTRVPSPPAPLPEGEGSQGRVREPASVLRALFLCLHCLSDTFLVLFYN